MSQTAFPHRVKAAAGRRVRERLRDQVPDLAPQLMQFAQFWPHDHGAATFSRPIHPDESTIDPASAFAVPPPELWAGYCTSAPSWLASGHEDVTTMARIMEESGAPIAGCERILELGCAAGRMIRWLPPIAPDAQLWGTDIWSTAILWCQGHLSPPCHFATNTMAPHLPFEDRSFDLVYAGSVFTHLDDLAETWFLELHRILRPGGRLYVTLVDEHAVRVFDGHADPADYPGYYERTGGKAEWDVFVRTNEGRPDYQRFRRGDAYMITLGRSMVAHVMWNSAELCRRLEYGYAVRAVTPESYGHQTTVLLERT